MTPSRLVVLHLPKPDDADESAPVVPVGICREPGDSATTVVVKATFTLVGSGAARTLALAPTQRPIVLQGEGPADLAPPAGNDAAPGASVVVSTAVERVVVTMPRCAPRLFRSTLAAQPQGEPAPAVLPGGELVPIALACDEVRVDLGAGLAEVVWRGTLSAAAVDFLALAIDDDRTVDLLAGELARARPSLAAERDASDASLDDAALVAARAVPWDAPAPAPRTTVATYAQISAELAERREPAGVTLGRHGLDEEQWTQEERGWLDAIATSAERGDATLVAELGEHFAAAQRALAAPDEGRRSLADYAAIRAALERAADPLRVLEARGLSLPAWMRLDARWSEGADADPSVAAALERELAQARARLGGGADESAHFADDETETAS